MSSPVGPDACPHPISSRFSAKAKLGVGYGGRGKPGSWHWTCETPLCLAPDGDRNSRVLAQNPGPGVETDSIPLLP